jgi:hypothetical protein
MYGKKDADHPVVAEKESSIVAGRSDTKVDL